VDSAVSDVGIEKDMSKHIQGECAKAALQQPSGTGEEIDSSLQRLVEMVDESGIEIGITLSIGAGVITGFLISMDHYFEQLAYDMSEPFDRSEQVQSLFRSLKPTVDTFGTGRFPRFIHLKNARTFLSGGKTVPDQESCLWRGKIASVDGFTMGIMGKA
jgi:uncharacterized protein YneF (UPF0154 family)